MLDKKFETEVNRMKKMLENQIGNYFELIDDFKIVSPHTYEAKTKELYESM